MQETAQEYTQRLLSYGDGKDPLRLQQAAPGKLTALLKGKTGKQYVAGVVGGAVVAFALP